MLYNYLLPAPGKSQLPEVCEKCPMPGARLVGTRGDPTSPLVIVGEGPGTEEIKYGAPFVGPSGDLLDKCIPESADFDDAFVINAMQCRVKTGSANRDKDLKSKACTACRSRLLKLIFAHPRKAVLALGAWSNGAILGDYSYKITVNRGEIYAIANPATGEEIPVIPAVHPAFLLRGQGNIKSFKDDVAEAYALAFPQYDSRRHEHDWYDPPFTVAQTHQDIQNFHALLRIGSGSRECAADIETSGFNFIQDKILCIGFYPSADTSSETAFIVPQALLESGDLKVSVALRHLLMDESITFIWQFGKFDEKFLRRAGLIDEERALVTEDTGLLSYAISEATRDHDLDEQAKNLLGAPNHKWVLKQWAPKKSDSYEKVPPDVLHDYLAKDVKKTLLVWLHNREAVRKDPALERLYTRTLIPASHLLAKIEETGIEIDWDYVRINRHGATPLDVEGGLIKPEDLDKERGLEWELQDIAAKLHAIAGWNINPNSPQEVATYLYDQLGLRIKNRRPMDTAKETLDKLPPVPAVKLIRSYRSVTKMLSTYVAAIEKMAIGSRIHCTYKLHASTTGRLSSSEPNLQNIPREPRYKRMYRAKPGSILLEGDYNSAELRMLAVLSGDPFLMGIFLDDLRNLHDEVSIQMYGPDFTRDQRIRAKAINFGIPYGREAFSIAEEFGIPPREAQDLIDAWFAAAPGAKAFIMRSRAAPLAGRSLVTVFGRKRRPGVVSRERLHELQNEFANFHMQSPISDFTLHSAMEMRPKLEAEGAHIVNLIHDSTLTECPSDSEDRIQQVAGILKETMERIPTYWIDTPIKFKTDLKRGTHWGYMKEYKL